LRRVFAAGEVLATETAAMFAERLPGVDLLNWYGPAEGAGVTAGGAAGAAPRAPRAPPPPPRGAGHGCPPNGVGNQER
uniref:hypothetical protein n=1 Tax=Nocardia farcinica TaxID=37329 RepID=UPI0024552212